MTPPKTEKKRHRRTAEEMISDLRAKIADVESRAKARAMKASPAAKEAIAAMRRLEKGLEASAQEGMTALQHAFADARKPLAEYLQAQGLKLRKARMPRGRRPSADRP